MAQNDYRGLDNGVLPWRHHLGHAPMSHVDIQPKEQFVGVVQQGRRPGKKSTSSAEMNSPVVGQTRSSPRAHKTMNNSNWASIGPRMQAVFLGPKKRSCGTGVFIPGSDPKPAFSPVLLPARVVRTLNLNVHELDQHIKPQQGYFIEENKNVKKGDENLEEDVSFSPEIFLPEEWTY